MIQKIRITRTDVRISQVFVEFQRLGSNPLSVFVITSVLCDFADVDFRIEVGSESLVVISGIAVYDVQVVDFIEMMFAAYAVYTPLTPGSNPQPRMAVSPASSKRFCMPTASCIQSVPRL